MQTSSIVAIVYPFSQFCEITIFLLILQKQPNTAPNLFQRGVEYGKYEFATVEEDLRWTSGVRHAVSPDPNNNNGNTSNMNMLIITIITKYVITILAHLGQDACDAVPA